MRKFGLLATLVLCAAALVFTACKAGDSAGSGRNTGTSETATTGQSPAQPAAAASPADGIRRISVTDAQKALTDGSAVMVDVRSPLEFDKGHIKGSLSLPKGEIAGRARELPKDKLIITYCA